MDISRRNTALDITRIIAFLSVICVHFFLNTEFYSTDMASLRMLLMTVMRTGFMICVPLFIMLTGYLMNKKTLSAKYYTGIVKILGIYLLSSIFCLIAKKFLDGASVRPDLAIFRILGYSASDYAWYIEMYIGLFLLIPFLNLIYNGLKTQKEKLILVITLLAVGTLPSLLNIFDFYTEGWWLTPRISTQYSKIVPEFWNCIYPFTYYFIGAYLKEFPIKMKKWLNILLILASVLVFGVFVYYRCHGGPFIWATYNDWFSFTTVIIAVLVFSFLSVRDTSKFPVWSKKLFAYLSDITLGAYLVSCISDRIVYRTLNGQVTGVLDRIYYFIPAVAASAAMALAVSAVISLIWQRISALGGKLFTKPNRSEAVAEAQSIIEEKSIDAAKK